jgi:hypothetical protein
MICEWQQPDFHPLSFARETRFSSKDPCYYQPDCDCSGETFGNYQHIVTTAVVDVSRLLSSTELMKRLADLKYDKVYVLCPNDQKRVKFINLYRREKEIIGKFQVVLSTQSPKEFAKHFLQGQRFELF